MLRSHNITSRAIFKILRVEWRNSTPSFALLSEREPIYKNSLSKIIGSGRAFHLSRRKILLLLLDPSFIVLIRSCSCGAPLRAYYFFTNEGDYWHDHQQ